MRTASSTVRTPDEITPSAVRGEWALKPPPRPAIFVAAFILREIWPADSLKTLAPRVNDRLPRAG